MSRAAHADDLLLRIDAALRAGNSEQGQFRQNMLEGMMHIRDELRHGARRFDRIDERLGNLELRQDESDERLRTHIADEESMLAPLTEKVDQIATDSREMRKRQDELYDVVQPAMRRAVRTLWRWASQRAREDGPLLSLIGTLLAALAGATYWIITGGTSLPKG